jgi:hypothetical protein
MAADDQVITMAATTKNDIFCIASIGPAQNASLLNEEVSTDQRGKVILRKMQTAPPSSRSPKFRSVHENSEIIALCPD